MKTLKQLIKDEIAHYNSEKSMYELRPDALVDLLIKMGAKVEHIIES